MGKAIQSQQHPAVVLRSSYTLVRALLAVAIVAVVGLTAAVVILANDSDEVTGASVPAVAPVPHDAVHGPSSDPVTARDLEAFGLTPEQAADEARPGVNRWGGPEEGGGGFGSAPSGNATGTINARDLEAFGLTPEQAADEARPGVNRWGGPDGH
jgi:hypothetical protein